MGMNEQSTMPASAGGSDLMTVAALRSELGLTLAEMGERIGLSKSQMHEVENSGRASLRVALEIERLSGKRIDAATLNDDVRAARHDADISGSDESGTTGQSGQTSGAVERSLS